MTDEETVIIDIGGDSGPYGFYCRSAAAEESPAPKGSLGFGTASVRVPAALFEEYETLTARVHEIEEEFERLQAAYSPKVV